jgi:CheY-like chemotaxis protein
MNQPEDRTVLIVEDEAIGALYLKSLVEKMGCHVVGVAASGPEAVELAHRHAPRAVITDVFLEGGMDGIEAANLIREACSAAVIYITGFPDQKTIARAEITQPAAYIIKPVEEQELKAVVEKVFGRQTGPPPTEGTEHT